MKIFKVRSMMGLFLVFTLLVTLTFPKQARAEMDPKLKAFLITSGYGVGGGALLGLASVALGAKARAIAQGASLGLYAGMIFGAYIILSHQYRMNNPEGSYQDAVTPYDGGSAAPYSNDPYADPYAAPSGGGNFRIQNQQFNRFQEKRGSSSIPVYLNFVNISF